VDFGNYICSSPDCKYNPDVHLGIGVCHGNIILFISQLRCFCSRIIPASYKDKAATPHLKV
jgi:hypothetical protein